MEPSVLKFSRDKVKTELVIAPCPVLLEGHTESLKSTMEDFLTNLGVSLGHQLKLHEKDYLLHIPLADVHLEDVKLLQPGNQEPAYLFVDRAVERLTKQFQTLKTEPISLTIDDIFDFMKSFNNTSKYNQGPPLISKFGLQFPLVGREKSIEALESALRRHFKALGTSGADRKEHPLPICAGSPGIGKTRMLHECKDILKKISKSFKMPAEQVEILITYHNGNGVHSIDQQNSEAAMAWRILYRYFIAGQKDAPPLASFFTENLPSNWSDLSLEMSLQTVAHTFDKEVLIFIGIDEFNKLLVGCQCKSMNPTSHTFLRHVYEAIGRVMCAPPKRTQVCALLCGTEVTPMKDLAAVSGYPLEPIPLSLVPMKLLLQKLLKTWDLDGIEATIDKDWLAVAPFRHNLHYFGGIMQFVYEYLRLVIEKSGGVTPSSINHAELQQTVEQMIEQKLSLVPPDDLLKLISVAISQTSVTLNQQFSDKLGTWESAQSHGLCSVMPEEKVRIPLCYLKIAARIGKTIAQDKEHPKSQIAHNLCGSVLGFFEHVDDNLYKFEDWRLFENFGVYEKAMSENALFYLGHTSCRFADLRRGAKIGQLGDVEVVLQPVSVVFAGEKLGENTGVEVFAFKRPDQKHNWIDGKVVVLNGSDGKGIDLWKRFPIPGTTEYLLELDQRKREAQKLTKAVLRTYYTRAKVNVKICSSDRKAIGIFSAGASTEPDLQLSPDCYVVSREQSSEYYGIFADHPVVSPLVNVNDPLVNASWIAGTLTGRSTAIVSKITKEVIAERKARDFVDLGDLRTRLQNKFPDDINFIHANEFLVFSWP